MVNNVTDRLDFFHSDESIFFLTNKLTYFNKILIFSRQNKTEHHFLRGWNCIYNICVTIYFLISDGIEHMNIQRQMALNLDEKFHTKSITELWVLMRI